MPFGTLYILRRDSHARQANRLTHLALSSSTQPVWLKSRYI